MVQPLEGMALLDAIARSQQRMSRTLQHVAAFCLEHHVRIHRCTITEVARACGTVPSTVVRFARLFRHPGYQSFRLAFVPPTASKPGASVRVATPGDGALPTTWPDELAQLGRALAGLGHLKATLVFAQALQWLGQAHALVLSHGSELDRLVALHLADKLHPSGKQIILSDQPLAPGAHMPVAHLLNIEVSLTRPVVALSTGGVRRHNCRQVLLLGQPLTNNTPSPTPGPERVVLPIEAAHASHRLHMALLLGDVWASALHRWPL